MTTPNRYSVPAAEIHSIICHQADTSDSARSQFLIRWISHDRRYPPLSWHPIDQLGSVLHLIQGYLADHPRGLKRKLSHAGQGAQLLTPSSGRSSAPGQDGGFKQATTFNAVIQRREGKLIAESCDDEGVIEMLDVRKLPTPDMLEKAQVTHTVDAEKAIQRRYRSKLLKLSPPVSFSNPYDNETPPLSFNFIDEYVLRKGVERRDYVMVGCSQCKPNMGANRGCEYTKRCDCLEFAAPDEAKMDEVQREDYHRRQDEGDLSTIGLPKRFPYYNTGPAAGCLVEFYLSERHPIYECNATCACGPNCKNRNVQHGRKVPLEVFKTPNRGFGLRCLVPLRKGQFLDTYLGEVITDAEADAREAASGPGKASYFFALDKFVGENIYGEKAIEFTDCHVVDGQFTGGPSRFINHRCGDPNLQMHTVSYNKYDPFIYDLAFFACCDIPAGEELTFDYMDADDIVGGEAAGDNERVAQNIEEGTKGAKEKQQCLCGSEHCRGFLWS